jgi:hypothetical protein
MTTLDQGILMACRQQLMQFFRFFLFIILAILGFFFKIFATLAFIKKYFCRFGTDSDFILRVAPLRDQKHGSYRNYFPPPLYGVPPNQHPALNKGKPEHYAKYGLFLWPDRLYQDINYYLLLLSSTLIPFLYLLGAKEGVEVDGKIYYILAALVFIIISMKITFIFVARTSPPVLNQVWSLWPKSHYARFLTVPHFSDIDKTDKHKEKHKYWNPDNSSPLSHQPSYYAKGKNSLQEVILHLAIFDYLFYPNEAKNNKKGHKYRKSLKVRGWLYLFSPAIITYAYLFILFFISSSLYPTSLTVKVPVLFQFPFFYTVLIVIWFLLTFGMIVKQIAFLETLQEDIREGYYNAHLDLIPQQILRVVAKIPDDKQISKGIEQVESVLRLVQAGALVTFLMLVEIFSSGFNGFST